MADPFNYMLNAPDPSQSVMQGIQTGLGVSSAFEKRDQEKIALQRQHDLQNDLADVSQNHSPAKLASLMVKYPELGKQLKPGYDAMTGEDQKTRINTASQVYAALHAGKPDIAQKILTDQAAAYQNSGQEGEAKTLNDLGELVKLSPDTAMTTAGLSLATLMGPDKFTETFSKLESNRRDEQMQPSKLSESEARAQKAAVDAKYAESKAVQDLDKAGWETKKLQNDIGISRQNSQIAAMNAQTARLANNIKQQGNDVKLQELKLKIQDKIAERDAKINEKASTVQSGRSTIDNFLNTADKIVQTPDSIFESATGTISSRLPTVDQDVADFEETLKTLGSQAFLSQVPSMKGLGALTEAEGKKLESSLANLSLRQSPKKLKENVQEAQRLMLKARKTLSDRYGVPDTIPDTPASTPEPSSIDALLQKYGGGQ